MTVRTFCRGPHMLHLLEAYALVDVLTLAWLLLEAAYNAPILEWHD